MVLRKLAHKSDTLAERERWFASLDAAKDMVRLPVLVFVVGRRSLPHRDWTSGPPRLKFQSTRLRRPFVIKVLRQQQVKHRYFHMFLVDWTLLLQRCSPYQHQICFEDSLNDVFTKEGQGMQVASHILHDDLLFAVLPTWTGVSNP